MRNDTPNGLESCPTAWIVGQPGGPSGPFYSVVSSTGQIIALQVPDGKVAARIARIPIDDDQDRRLVADLEAIRNAILSGDADQIRGAVGTINFWLSVYGTDNDGS